MPGAPERQGAFHKKHFAFLLHIFSLFALKKPHFCDILISYLYGFCDEARRFAKVHRKITAKKKYTLRRRQKSLCKIYNIRQFKLYESMKC